MIWVLLICLYCFHTATGPDGGSVNKVVGVVGRGVLLPCGLQVSANIEEKTVEWARLDLQPEYVHIHRHEGDVFSQKNPSYIDRTMLFMRQLKNGNASLLISDVKLSDGGRYRCRVDPPMHESFIDLVIVQTVSEPPRVPCEISVLDHNDSGMFLQCESKGWPVRPEVFWLDGEGNVLPAEPSEKIRDPDGLYTVRSNVTVKNNNNNTCTCRAPQQNSTLTAPAGETTCHADLNLGLVILVIVLGISVIVLGICVYFLCHESKKNKREKFNMPTQSPSYKSVRLADDSGIFVSPHDVPVSPSANHKPIDHSTPSKSGRQADDSGIAVSPETSGLYSD